MNFRTLADLNSTIFSHLQEIPKDIDIVAGIPRSGLLVANIIALYLNLPLTDIDSLAEGRIYATGHTRPRDTWVKDIHEARKILVVDDSTASGQSLNEAREKLRGTPFYNKALFMAVYAARDSQKFADIWFETADFPRMFEWNYLHRPDLSIACFDIDGVLCPDPTEEQNDDGSKYVEFIRNVPARFVPTFEIGCIITSRLEKYRADTEYWLNKNNIRYGRLIMMNFATKEERIRSGSYGRFKAEHYIGFKDSDMFIESNARIAEEIAKLSGKPVFCTDTQEFFPEGITRKIRRALTPRHLIGMMLPRRVKDIIKRLIRR